MSEQRSTNRPPVSCMCLTYGRNTLLEEAIYSFLRQDYAGKKELVVLNDLADQALIFDHPEVTIINLKERVTLLGKKRNLCAEIASHDILLPWDDDDIYLPNRLSCSVDAMQNLEIEFFKPDRAYYWNRGQLDELCRNVFHGQSCYTRDLFSSVGGYAAMGSGEDQEFEYRLLARGVDLCYPLPLVEYFYLYRWGGIPFYHLSAFGQDGVEEPGRGEQLVESIIQHNIAAGLIPIGEILLEPHWAHDYLELKIEFDRKLQALRDCPDKEG